MFSRSENCISSLLWFLREEFPSHSECILWGWIRGSEGMPPTLDASQTDHDFWTKPVHHQNKTGPGLSIIRNRFRTKVDKPRWSVTNMVKNLYSCSFLVKLHISCKRDSYWWWWELRSLYRLESHNLSTQASLTLPVSVWPIFHIEPVIPVPSLTSPPPPASSSVCLETWKVLVGLHNDHLGSVKRWTAQLELRGAGPVAGPERPTLPNPLARKTLYQMFQRC